MLSTMLSTGQLGKALWGGHLAISLAAPVCRRGTRARSSPWLLTRERQRRPGVLPESEFSMNIDTCPLFSNWSRAMRGLSAPYAQGSPPRRLWSTRGFALRAVPQRKRRVCWAVHRVASARRDSERRPAEAGGGASCLHRNELQDWELTVWLTTS